MKNKILKITIICFLFFQHSARAQSYSGFVRNLIKVEGKTAQYGFVTGADKIDKSVFFIKLQTEEDGRFEERLSVLVKSNKNKGDKETVSVPAVLISSNMKIAKYFIGVYKISRNLPIETNYFRPLSSNVANYNMFQDNRRQSDVQKTLFEPHLSRQTITVEGIPDEISNTKILSFETEKAVDAALVGTPILDAEGFVTAVIAESQLFGQLFISAVNIKAIQQALSELGKGSGNPCRYFNLIEHGSYSDETPCQREARLKREEEKRQQEAEERRVKELRQENLKRIVEMHNSGNRDPEVRRIYNMHRDRFLAVSIGGSGNLTSLSMQAPPEDNIGKTSAGGAGYSVGGNIYINPDKGHFRMVLKSRYSYQALAVSDKYRYKASSEFTLKKIKLKAYELTIMPEFVLKRMENGDNFFNFGYGAAKHISADFEYGSEGETNKEPVLENTTYSQHAYAEIGASRGKARYGLFIRYQTTPFIRKDYEFIEGGQAISPFRDVSKGYLIMGLDLQLRLWNRWKNDYRTIF